ncbi:MAG: CPBP family intramembrane metalloprotease [Anaerolineales bacterium]|nr:MAG: CPBP family intramembrane metalloprotease [Anaerolineales bacterium]
MDPTHEAGRASVSRGLILLFCTLAGLLVISGGSIAMSITSGLGLSTSQQVAFVRGSYAVMILGSLAATVVLHKNTHLRPFWRLAFAYFVACCAIMVSDYTGDWALNLSGQALNTAKGFAALKLGEDAAIVGTIIVLTLLTRDDPNELFLSKGRLGLGLVVGASSFLVFTVVGLSSTIAKGIQPDKVGELLPAFLLIALADGLMEELLFRGLFLRRLGRFVGDNWANIVTAIVFTFMHMGVQFTATLPVFLMIVLLLGLLWGWIMQKTGSVLAPALFHAGVDMLIIADSFAAFDIRN